MSPRRFSLLAAATLIPGAATPAAQVEVVINPVFFQESLRPDSLRYQNPGKYKFADAADAALYRWGDFWQTGHDRPMV